jgi:hypothetical protein
MAEKMGHKIELEHITGDATRYLSKSRINLYNLLDYYSKLVILALDNDYAAVGQLSRKQIYVYRAVVTVDVISAPWNT